MPNFVGCRCCKRVMIVLASDGKINFVSGSGTDLGQITDSSIGSEGEVHWLKKNRWAWVNTIAGTSACIFRGDRSAITDSTNGWFTAVGDNSFRINSMAVGAAGKHIGMPNANGGTGDYPAKIFDQDGTYLADVDYDNGGNQGSPTDPYDLICGYVNGKFTIETLHIVGTDWQNTQYLFNDDGTLDSSFDVNAAFSVGSPYTSRANLFPVADGFIGIHTYSSALKVGKLDLTGSFQWRVSAPSGLFTESQFQLLPNGNFILWANQSGSTPFHVFNSSTGSIVKDFRPMVGETVTAMAADPYDSDLIYCFMTSQELIKYRISTGTIIWTDGFTGYDVYSIDSIAI